MRYLINGIYLETIQKFLEHNTIFYRTIRVDQSRTSTENRENHENNDNYEEWFVLECNQQAEAWEADHANLLVEEYLSSDRDGITFEDWISEYQSKVVPASSDCQWKLDSVISQEDLKQLLCEGMINTSLLLQAISLDFV